MRPKRLPNGNLLVPVRLEAEDGTLGDGVVEIDHSDPEFEAWERELDGER